MVIAVIGSGISGLIAGDILAKAGHEVMLFEKELEFGGRLSSVDFGINSPLLVDYKAPIITAETEAFKAFLDGFVQKGKLKVWADYVSCFDGRNLIERYPSRDPRPYYCSVNGMNEIGRELSRWLDVNRGDEVIGITHIGKNRTKKKAWMVNLKSFKVFEADAVIIALPSIRANAIMHLTQDEVPVRKLIREAKNVTYNPTISFLLNYGNREFPNFKAIECVNSSIKLVVNESAKRADAKETVLNVQTTIDFYRSFENKTDREATDAVLRELATIVGTWAAQPIKTRKVVSRYKTPATTLNVPFLVSEDADAPLALVGDYFQTTGIESAYTSGQKLAEHWLSVFNSRKTA